MGKQSDLIYGIHAVGAAIQEKASDLRQIWVAAGAQSTRVTEIIAWAKRAHIPVSEASQHEMELMTEGAVHQGIVARVEQLTSYEEADLEALLSRSGHPALLLILDGVQDPHNLGACMRSANAAGVQAVIAPRDRAVGMTPVVRKVASGAAESTPFIQVTNLARTMRTLKDMGIWLVGTDGDSDEEIYASDLTGPIALVLGAEGDGLRRLTKQYCDYLVKIPMMGTVESLNVSVAAGICLFEAVRQRRAK